MNAAPNRELAVFSAARRLPAAERAAYMDQTCAGDAALRRKIEDLLRASEDAAGFLQEPAPGALRPEGVATASTLVLNLAAPGEKVGDRIGRYKLLQQIGEGGCGLVYMAEQEEPVRRRVALKVIKLGMDTKSVIARFEAERQALALMDHPNIAKVLDAGATETGRPYFVMELVRGIKITDYCDEHNLSTRERLELFIQVCQAVQHAHQKGIIHRDLKPSNILVASNDGVPVPKVIDFGIAKATQGRLTDQTLFTALEQFIGTPAYMSPEQAELTMQDVDTRTDIYSLGVLLYELLTGRTPFDAQALLASGLDAMRRTIREQEPVRPSTRLSTMLKGELTTTAKHRHTEAVKLVHLLRGDLDWIVMKCLEKDRARRYETANGLARDIERYLNNDPVSARPPTAFYRFQKAIRRHKAAFGAAVGVATVLLIGMGVSTSEAIRAARAEQEQMRLRQQAQANQIKAEAEAANNRQTAQFLKDMLASVGPSVALGRDTTILREIMDSAAAHLGTEFTNQPELEIDLGTTLTSLYQEAGFDDKAEEIGSGTLRTARERFGDENTMVADLMVKLGQILYARRKFDEAEQMLRQAVALERKLRGGGSAQDALALRILGDVLRGVGKIDEAEAPLRESLAIYRRQPGEATDNVAWTHSALSLLLRCTGRLAESEKVLREGLAIRQRIHGELHPYTAYTYYLLGDTLGESPDKLSEAAACYTKGLDIMKKLGAAERGTSHAFAQRGFAGTLRRQGRLEEAEPHQRLAIASMQKISPDYPDLAAFFAELAIILKDEGKPAEARSAAEDAVALCRRLQGQYVGWAQREAYETLSDFLKNAGETNALEKLTLERSQYLRMNIAKGKVVDPIDLNEVARILATSPNASLRDGTNAIALAETAVAATRRTNPGYLDTLAAAYAEAGQFDKAVTTEQDALALAGPEEGITSRLKLYQSNSTYREN